MENKHKIAHLSALGNIPGMKSRIKAATEGEIFLIATEKRKEWLEQNGHDTQDLEPYYILVFYDMVTAGIEGGREMALQIVNHVLNHPLGISHGEVIKALRPMEFNAGEAFMELSKTLQETAEVFERLELNSRMNRKSHHRKSSKEI